MNQNQTEHGVDDQVPEARHPSLGTAPESLDVVTAFYSILHVPRHEHPELLARLATWLRPGGWLTATLGGGIRGGEGIDKAWLGVADVYWSNWELVTNRRLSQS